jgi:hypothetical protein
MNKRVLAILKNIIRDIASKDFETFREVSRTLDNPIVITLLLEADCPKEIIEAMRDTLPLSVFERRYCCRKIERSLKELNK